MTHIIIDEFNNCLQKSGQFLFTNYGRNSNVYPMEFETESDASAYIDANFPDQDLWVIEGETVEEIEESADIEALYYHD